MDADSFGGILQEKNQAGLGQDNPRRNKDSPHLPLLLLLLVVQERSSAKSGNFLELERTFSSPSPLGRICGESRYLGCPWGRVGGWPCRESILGDLLNFNI